jgi:hypothetical protein
MSLTLGFYIARRFLSIAISAFLAVFVLVATIDLVELMRSSGNGLAGFSDLLGMALLHAPSITVIAAPFTVRRRRRRCRLGACAEFRSRSGQSDCRDAPGRASRRGRRALCLGLCR